MRTGFVAIFLALAAAPGWAAPVTYACSVKPTDDGLIPGPFTITIDQTAERAAVKDALTDQFNDGRPVETSFRQLRNGQIRATWELPGLKTSRKVTWQVQLNPSTGQVTYRLNYAMVGQDRDGPPGRRGSCQTVPGPNLLN